MSLATNRKATFDYEVLEKISAGLELLGSEVKSLRAGKISLVGSHVIVRGNEAFLMGAEVPPYQPKNVLPDYDPKRPKKLLLTQNELKRLSGAEATKGLTIVPLSVYNKGRFLK
ncbi:MAG: SsrA-binding protein, partial [Parcubacteria group bacterium]